MAVLPPPLFPRTSKRMWEKSYHICISRCAGVSAPPPFLSCRHTPPHSCSPSCSLTPKSRLCSSASQAQADTCQLPSSTAIACMQDLPPHPRVHIPNQRAHTRPPHLHMLSLSILSWRWDETQRVPTVQALKMPESFWGGIWGECLLQYAGV